MIQILRSVAELSQIPGPLFVAIGVFDGVHLGHCAVIQRAQEDAARAGGSAVVITFDPHPARLLRPEHAPRLLTSTPHKVRLIGALGVRHLLIIPFDAEFAVTPPADFIRALAAAARPLREVCVGFEWCFGRNRAGNLQLLDELGEELGFEEVGIPAVKIDGQVVSSTIIRRAVERGDFAFAARCLGRAYTVLGTVLKGRQIGRTIGFPTANLSAHNEQFPPDGVYAVEISRGSEILHGVANIGLRPTVEGGASERTFEVHIFDFSGELYGEDMEVTFRHFIRPEQKFASLEELRRQIGQDAESARLLFSA